MASPSNTSSSSTPTPAPPARLRVTVLVTTKDRKDELRRALKSCFEQTEPLEVLVIDDGSSDGTSEMVKREFPRARLVRNETPLGIVDARNKAADAVTTPILITLDDDALFSTPKVVEQTLAEFNHARVAVVTIPLINFLQDGTRDEGTLYRPADPGALNVSAVYLGGSNAMRLDIFRKLGKYRGYLFRQGEESDYGIRVLNAGYITRVGQADLVHHFPSPSRDTKAISRYAARNSVLFAWHNVPSPLLYVHWAGTTFNLIRFGFKKGHTREVLGGLWEGFKQVRRYRDDRAPVSPAAYRLFRQLMRAPGGCVPLESIEGTLGAPKAV